MRTKPATKYNNKTQHSQYGIYHWFILKGIVNKDVMKEVMYVFCENQGYEMNHIKDETKKLNFIQNRFGLFAPFAAKYLKENNYLTAKKVEEVHERLA